MRKLLLVLTAVSILATLVPMLPASAFAATPTFADQAFKNVWDRTDYLVSLNAVERSWYWGPTPLFQSQERYGPNAGDSRLVQYFDKSRMEINNPAGDRSSQWFVTNGLLVKELISGQMQISDSQFEARTPADIPVAGDPRNVNPNAPSYAALAGVASLQNDKRAANRVGQVVDETIGPDGKTGENANLGLYAGTKIAQYDDHLGHNIPQAFWDFMTSNGSVLVNGQVRNETLIDWVFVMGYPITEPYWARVVVGGRERDVMIQAFERRVLTYTPSNAVSWQVEMGNVGQHYYNWRYNSATLTVDPASAKAGTPFAFTARGFGAGEQLSASLSAPDKTVFGSPWQVKADGSGQAVLYFWSPKSTQPGKWKMTVQGATTGRKGVASFTVEQADVGSVSLTVQPGSGPKGTRFDFTGSGFAAGELVSVWLTGPDGATQGSLGQYAAGDDGKVTFKFKSGANSQVGSWTARAKGVTSGRSADAQFTITGN
ncbi:MAG: hypothetical protein M1319_02125 [Chloroflexi bacterium]|nr:hypothetical protein [Chloroflexota bacterium]